MENDENIDDLLNINDDIIITGSKKVGKIIIWFLN